MASLQPETASNRISTPLPQSSRALKQSTRGRSEQWQAAKRSFRRHWQLYLIMMPALLYFLIFRYIPMANAVIAFKEYNVVAGIWGSPWVGFKYFSQFFSNPVFWNLLKNTLGLSIYALVVGFPLPILLAICLNEVSHGFFKRSVQMVTYAPYFISTVVMVSMIMLLLSPRLGIVNLGLNAIGVESVNFLGRPALFPSVYVWSGVWQNSGYAAIVYLAALAGVECKTKKK